MINVGSISSKLPQYPKSVRIDSLTRRILCEEDRTGYRAHPNHSFYPRYSFRRIDPIYISLNRRENDGVKLRSCHVFHYCWNEAVSIHCGYRAHLLYGLPMLGWPPSTSSSSYSRDYCQPSVSFLSFWHATRNNLHQYISWFKQCCRYCKEGKQAQSNNKLQNKREHYVSSGSSLWTDSLKTTFKDGVSITDHFLIEGLMLHCW